MSSHTARHRDSSHKERHGSSRGHGSHSTHKDEQRRPPKRARKHDSDFDDDEPQVARARDDVIDKRDEMIDKLLENEIAKDDSSDEGDWVEQDAQADSPKQPSRDSWMKSDDGGFDFGLMAAPAGEHGIPKKRTVLPDRKPKSANDPYFVSASDAPPTLEPAADDQVRTSEATTVAPQPVPIDETKLNRMKAAYLKAKLRGAPNALQLEQEYNDAMSKVSGQHGPESGDRVETLSMMDTRGLLSAPSKTDDDMTIADMVAEEKRTRGLRLGNEARMFADRIGRDKKYKDSLDYMDENADKLAKRVQRKQIDLKNMAIDEIQKMNSILDSCPLCQSDTAPPTAPVVSTATRVFLTLPTMPQLSPGAASIVPISHRRCTLECDDDEWEEIRNFMKCLARMYHSQNRGVIFYENAASLQRRRHASIEAVPLPYELAETAPAYFKEAMLSSDEEWSSHQKIINTLERATKGGLGRKAFRQSLVKEAPYFHVWFTIDGGYGHVVEDADRWPRGDLFAREILGGMLELEPDVIKRQSQWATGVVDPRLKGFHKMWDKFDWTKELADNPDGERY